MSFPEGAIPISQERILLIMYIMLYEPRQLSLQPTWAVVTEG